jgi:hypothetical protein
MNWLTHLQNERKEKVSAKSYFLKRRRHVTMATDHVIGANTLSVRRVKEEKKNTSTGFLFIA